jgi:hypothetical protein
MTKFLCGLLLLLTGCALGFLAGRHSARQAVQVETVEYVQEPAIAAVIEIPEPVKVELPALPALPVRTDTVYVDRVMQIERSVDTAAIIRDYELKRSYVVPLFDSQYGKLDVSLSTQYNRLEALSYEFIPVTKVVYREKTWRPFACLTYGSLGYVGAGAGIFYKSTGISIQYLTDFKKNGFGISVVRMF